MDELDHHGNTPLLLALQLGRLECANVGFVEGWNGGSLIASICASQGRRGEMDVIKRVGRPALA